MSSNLIKMDWKPSTSQLRQFGWIGLVAFAALGGLVFWKHRFFIALSPDAARTTATVLWALAGFCGLFAAAAPVVLRPLYVGLMVVSYPIGLVVSNVVLGLIYFGVFTPLALVFRLIGRDALQRRYLPAAPSYWEARTPVTDSRRYFRQF
ncbi:MAG: SxtJ family membrane protein [Phycisphaerae bacterium]